MAIVKITESILQNIANAIRTKKNTNTAYSPANMATEISTIETGPQPITVNITQSANQTIKVSSSVTNNWSNRTTSGSYSTPTSVQLTATVTPSSGYNAGTLNQSSVTAYWGNTYSFSATPAVQRIGTLNLTMSSTANHPGLGTSITVTYTFTAVGGTTNAQTFTDEYNANTISIPSLSENQTRTYTTYFSVSESDIIAGYVNCDVIQSSGQFTKSGSFTIATQAANPSLSVDIGGIDFNDPLEEGSSIYFDVIVTNNGNLTVTGVTVTSELTNDEWPIDSLAPGASITLSTEYTIESIDVENEYVRLDGNATASNPIPNGAQITASDYEDIEVYISIFAIIYLAPPINNVFTVSSNMTNNAQSTLNAWVQIMGINNFQLNTFYTNGEFTGTITPTSSLCIDPEDPNYNGDSYIIDTSNNQINNLIYIMTDPVTGDYFGGLLSMGPIINSVADLSDFILNIQQESIDMTNATTDGMFMIITNFN